MHISEYKNIFHNEETHFFYRSTHAIVVNLIKKFLPTSEKLHILDAGCGTGRLAVLLQQLGAVEAVDISGEAIRYAKKRGIDAKKASIMNLPFHDSTFSLVTSIDVLYHQHVQDTKALKEIHRVLKKKGYLIIRVPANPLFSTSHDRLVHTRHRYTQSELTQKLEDAGFLIVYSTAVHSVLIPFVLMRKLQEKIKGSAPHTAITSVNRYVNILLTAILLLEVKFL